MSHYFLPIDLLFFGAAIVSFLLAVIILIKRTEPGGVSFACVMFSISLWLIFRVFEGVADTVSNKVFWAKFEYLGIVTLPVFYFVFASQYSRKDKWITTRNIILISIIPALTLILVFVNEKHGLIWKNIYPADEGGIGNLVYEHGSLFWVYFVYGYILIMRGMIRLITTFLNYPREHRIQVAVLIFATLMPWGGNLLYLMGRSPIKGMDLTPIGLTLSGLVLTISLYRGQIFEVVPIARNIIFDNMQEGILVLEIHKKIVDVNSAACGILKISRKQIIKQSLDEALSPFPHLLEKLKNPENQKFEICLDETAQTCLQVSTSTIVTNVNPVGQLIVIQDISKRKQLEMYEQEQRKFAEALSHIAATLNSSLELEVILERVLDSIHEVVPHDAANIALLENGGKMRFVKLKGYEKFGSKEAIQSLDYIIDDIPDFKMMAREKIAVVVSDTKAYPNWVANPEVEWIRSYIGSPIVVGDKVIGFINVDSKTPNFYNQSHAQRLKVFADETAIAIQNARYVEELKQRNQELMLLYEVGMAMTEGLDIHEVVSGLFKQVETLKNIDLFLLGLFNKDNKYPLYLYNSEDKTTQMIEIVPDLQNDLLKQLLDKKTTVYVKNYKTEDIPPELKKLKNYPIENIHSSVNIPLLEGGEIIGIMTAGNRREGGFNENQIRFLETIASQVAITLQNVIMYDRMKELAIIDELTGIYNRRFLYLAANKELDRSRRYNKDLSMILIDIDHFKEVNDHFGHLAGDKVLQKITQVAQKELRSSDVFARYGGEEFLILLADTDGEAAVRVAERIRYSMESLRVKYMEDEISVTISLGVTRLSSERETLQEIIATADQALYEAKQKGRNRVEYIP
ncbi:MAG TPA: hypothetical protein DCK95_08950 [Anaerolineaceae bacterium]|nr:hypothetical protein [Anaerolineaceae bacterium]